MSKTGIVACFGEILLRYSPAQDQALRNAASMDVFVGGAEANVAAGLANLGRNTRMISALPDNELGAMARRALQREGVDTSTVAERSGRMGVYYVTPAGPMQQSTVIYDREGSSFAGYEGLDHEAALAEVRHLHVSGISLAVSEASRANTLKLAQIARDKAISVSFDGNFRPALWKSQQCDPQPIIAEMVSLADVFFGNHKDMALLLGREFSGDDEDSRRTAALAGLEAFPNLSLVVSTVRKVDEVDTHRIAGRIDTADAAHQSLERTLPNVIDRIGTGDAFAAGVIDGWLANPRDLAAALEQGMILAALKHYSRGDFSLANRTDMNAAASGKGDVVR